MLKKLLFLGCFLNMITSINAQTTLSAGDMAIIGINYDAVPYEMTIMNLVPIASGTVIRITDYGYDEITGTFGTTSVANTSEGSITWTTTSAMAAGTVTKFTINAASGTPVITGLPGTVSATGWTNTTTTSCPSPAGGDNWFIFQGTSPTSVTTYVFAWCNPFPTTFNSINQPAGQFLVSGSGQPNNGNSYLPPTLILGTNAISLSRDPANGGYHGDNNVYIGSLTGTKSAIMTAICTISNWNHNEDTTYDITPSGTTFTGTNPIFTITPPNNAPTNIALSASAINENVAANSTVGTLSSTDTDAGNTFTYTLVAGTGSTDNAAFNISGSSLRITASPDFETKSSYSVRVRTTDQGGLFFERTFTITINDLCDLNNSVTLTAGVLTATQTGATYQWRKCSDNSPVGTNSNTYTPTVTGDYKVDITSGSCTVTSACVTVSTLGTINVETKTVLLIYPNPSQGIINIKSDSDGDFQVLNQTGQILKTFKVKANVTNTIDLQNLNDTIYFIKEVKHSKAFKLIIKK